MTSYDKAIALAKTAAETAQALALEMRRLSQQSGKTDQQVFDEIKTRLDENDRLALENSEYFSNLLNNQPK